MLRLAKRRAAVQHLYYILDHHPPSKRRRLSNRFSSPKSIWPAGKQAGEGFRQVVERLAMGERDGELLTAG